MRTQDIVRGLPDYELEKELERRKQVRENLEIPTMQSPIDWDRVITAAYSRRDSVVEGTYKSADAQYFFADVMTAVFGKDYFKWENKKTN